MCKTMTREPVLKDKVKGVISFSKDLCRGIVAFDLGRIGFDWFMVKETIKGNFRVVVRGDEKC